MPIGQAGGAGAAPSPTPNIITQRHAGGAEDTNGQMISEKDMSRRHLDLFAAAGKWSKPAGTEAELAALPKVKIGQAFRLIDQWDEAIDTNPGDVPLQTLTGILRKLFDDAFANRCKKLLLVSDRGQIIMTRRGLGAEMYAHIEGEENYKKEMHRSIDDKLTLSVLRALYRDNTVQNFLPLNGTVGRKPDATDMPNDTDAPDNMGSRRGSDAPSFPGYDSDSESESEPLFKSKSEPDLEAGVFCVHFASPDAILGYRLSGKPSADVNTDHIQYSASDFDKDAFDRDAGLTEERNLVHSDFGSSEQIIPEQIALPAANELSIGMSSPVKPINDSDPENGSLINVEFTVSPDGTTTTSLTINGHLDSNITELPTPSLPSSPAPAVVLPDNEVDGARYQKNLKDFNARPKTEIDYEKGLPIRNEMTEVTHL